MKLYCKCCQLLVTCILLQLHVNIKKEVRHSYDLEVFRTMARLIQHTAQTYNDLSSVEKSLAQGNRLHYEDHDVAYQELGKITGVLENYLTRRKNVFNDLVSTREKSRPAKRTFNQ